MDGKVPPDGPPATRTEGEGETLDMQEGCRGGIYAALLWCGRLGRTSSMTVESCGRDA